MVDSCVGPVPAPPLPPRLTTFRPDLQSYTRIKAGWADPSQNEVSQDQIDLLQSLLKSRKERIKGAKRKNRGNNEKQSREEERKKIRRDCLRRRRGKREAKRFKTNEEMPVFENFPMGANLGEFADRVDEGDDLQVEGETEQQTANFEEYDVEYDDVDCSELLNYEAKKYFETYDTSGMEITARPKENSREEMYNMEPFEEVEKSKQEPPAWQKSWPNSAFPTRPSPPPRRTPDDEFTEAFWRPSSAPYGAEDREKEGNYRPRPKRKNKVDEYPKNPFE